MSHLIPEHTEVTEDFLGVIVRNSLITDDEFLQTIQKIKDKDPETLEMIKNPREDSERQKIPDQTAPTIDEVSTPKAKRSIINKSISPREIYKKLSAKAAAEASNSVQ